LILCKAIIIGYGNPHVFLKYTSWYNSNYQHKPITFLYWHFHWFYVLFSDKRQRLKTNP